MSDCRNYMKKLLLLLFIFQKSVKGCLVVHQISNPNMNGCKCNVELANQEDIRKNEGGKYLGDHQVWDPIVEAGDDCSLRITCKPVTGISSFFTVMFRSNGPPLYINRVVANQSTFIEQPRSINNVHCTERTGAIKWYYYDFVLEDFSLACVADAHSCDCPQIATDTESGAISENRMPSAADQCGFFKANCSVSDRKPFLKSPTTGPIFSAQGVKYFGSNDTVVSTGSSL